MDLSELYERSELLVARVPTSYKRSDPKGINWEWKMNAIIGARGVGKTTMLLQRLKEAKEQGEKSIYVSLDDPFFTENSLYEVAGQFSREGGRILMIDEVHKYPKWSSELKNIYDYHQELKVVFTGSSILDIHHQESDLSRRALFYHLPGLSFREYLSIRQVGNWERLDLETVLQDHQVIAGQIVSQIKPLAYFKDYLREGYYPFFLEEGRNYQLTLMQLIGQVMETDVRLIRLLDPQQVRKMKLLLRIIAQSSPFKPNVAKLSERIEISRKTFLEYISDLERARLVKLANRTSNTISVLQKPDKIYLDNPNLYFAMGENQADIGALRETFFINQVDALYQVNIHTKTDFLVEGTYSFEIRGRNKSKKQIKGIEQSFVAADDYEIGSGQLIPLWLFGFLY